MRISLLCFVVIMGFVSNAQIVLPGSNLDSGNVVFLRTDGHLGGTVISNQFLDKFIYGGEIDSLLKSGLSEDLESNNAIGGELTTRLQYHSTKPLFKNTQGWYVGLGTVMLEGLNFGKDLFDLAFYGNQPFEGGTAQIDLRYRSFSYQKLTFGIDLNKGLKLGISVLKASRFANININNSTFTTGQGGSSLYAYLSADAEYTDLQNVGFLKFNGFGFGMDAQYVLETDQGSSIVMSIEDLGFLRTRATSNRIKKDTSYNYVGFDVSDLVRNRPSFDNIEDSLGLVPGKQSVNSVLPFLIQVYKPMNLKSKESLKPYFGLRYRHLYNTIPELYFGTGYQPSKAMLIHGAIGYGGYFDLHFKAGFQLFFSEHYKLTVDTMALLNSITATGKGRSLQIGFYAVL